MHAQLNIRGIQAATQPVSATELVAEIKSGFEAFKSQHEIVQAALGDRLLELEQRNVKPVGTVGAQSRAGFGASVSAAFSKHRDALRQNGRVSFDVVAELTGADTGATASPTTPITPNLQPGWLSDYLPRVPADSEYVVDHLRVTGVAGGAGVQVAELDLKAQAQPSMLRVAQRQITIAAWCSASEQSLQFEQSLQQVVDGNLRREVLLAMDSVLVDGNTASGADAPFDGYETLATSYVSTFTAVRDAAIQCAISMRQAGFAADTICINPVDFAEILLERDSQGRYQSVVDPFPGLRVALSDNVAVGAPLVLDSRFLALHVGRDLRLQLGYSGDGFKSNEITLRAELFVAPVLWDTRALRQVMPAGSP